MTRPTPKKTEPRKQHIVPRVHLKWFVNPTDPPYLRIYEKGIPGSRRRSINQVLRIKDYYTLRNDGGARDYVVETRILGQIEEYAEPIFRRLNEDILDTVLRSTKSQRSPLTDSERDILAEYLAYQRLRVPTFQRYMSMFLGEEAVKFQKSMASDRDKFKVTVDNLAKDGLQLPDGITIDDMRAYVLSKDEYEWRTDKQSTLVLSVEKSNILKQQFLRLRWRFFVPMYRGDDFATGDNPVVLVDPARMGIPLTGIPSSNKDVILVFPIGADVALLGDQIDGDDMIGPVDSGGHRFFNQWIITGADKYVCARSESDEFNEQFATFSQAKTYRKRDLPEGEEWPDGLKGN